MLEKLFPKRIPKLNPIIIYQMGKVGSSTLHASLAAVFQSHSIKLPVFQTHNLNNLDKLEEAIRNWSNPERALRQLEKDKSLRKKLDANPNSSWNVITLTRDPVARNISTFCEMCNIFFPDWKIKYEQGLLDLREMQTYLVSNFSPGNAPDKWFDQQLKPVFEVDVYAKKFPHKAGYAIYRCRNNGRMLLLRLEDLYRVAPKAIKKFLGIDGFSLLDANESTNRDFAVLYKEIKKLAFPMSYLKTMYNTKYVKHFYTKQEIEKFYERWAYPDKK